MSNAMNRPDAQKILGIAQNATAEEIKAAYKKLALEHHPDRNFGNEEAANKRMQSINDAYKILGHTDKSKADGSHRCYFCNNPTDISELCFTPCCFEYLNFCKNCANDFIVNNKGMKCPNCSKTIAIKNGPFGVCLLKTFPCNGPACTKITSNRHGNPCCNGDIYLCGTCSNKSQMQCLNCKKDILIKKYFDNTTIYLEKALKKCSTCPNEIPQDTKNNYSPCCHSVISLCEVCSTQSLLQCSGCNKNIAISKKYGSITLEKTKKCSVCVTRIPDSSQYSYCPYFCHMNISLCGACASKSHIECPSCNKNIEIKNTDGNIQLNKPPKMKQCSACPTQIPDNIQSTMCPYLSCHNNLSLCDNCATQMRIQCSGCHNNLAVDNRYGYVGINKLKQCSACPNQISDNTEYNYSPCCHNRVSLCDICSIKPQVPCPNCPKNIAIENKFGRIQLEEIADKGSFTGKVIMLGSGVIALWCCSSAWNKYVLRNELDAIGQHAKKITEEIYSNNEKREYSLSIREQFDIPALLKKLTNYAPETTDFENAINAFDEVIGAKNSNQEAIYDSFEVLAGTINDYKNRIGSPTKNLLGASIVAIGGFFWF